MVQTVDAIIDESGNVRLLEPLHFSSARRALVTILDENGGIAAPEAALLSEVAADLLDAGSDFAETVCRGLAVRDVFEHAVGHGVSAMAKKSDETACPGVAIDFWLGSSG